MSINQTKADVKRHYGRSDCVFQTVRQTAKALRIPEHLVRSMVAQGTCPGIYSGNRFLVHVEALREYLDAASGRKEAKGE